MKTVSGLAGRTALVTGGSRGIGAAIAARYARQGMHTAVQYHNSREEAEALAALLEREGCPAPLLLQADVSVPEQALRLVEEALEHFGGLDVLVNNAGIYEETPFDTERFDQWQAGWQRVLDTNLMSAVHTSWAVLPSMRARGGGKIIQVASRAAFRAETTAPAYAVSKAGMVNLTRCLARAEAQHGVLAYCIAPGWVETAMAREAVAVMRDEIEAQIPLGRIASVEDVAGAALFFASDDANYLTGVTLDVNGGSYLH